MFSLIHRFLNYSSSSGPSVMDSQLDRLHVRLCHNKISVFIHKDPSDPKNDHEWECEYAVDGSHVHLHLQKFKMINMFPQFLYRCCKCAEESYTRDTV